MEHTTYPVEFESDVELADGGTAFVRPVRPTDGSALVDFHGRQSSESIYYRFFSPHPTLSDSEVEHFVNVDHLDRFALVAFVDDRLIGIARYDRPKASQSAEVAFFIDDQHHGRGLATILLEHLAEAARRRGITGFWATVLPENRRMVAVFRRAGFGVSSRFSDGVIEVELELDPTEVARVAIEERAREAQQQAVRRLLEPATVAVIGASTHHDGLGRRVLDSIADHGFRGEVVVVHPDAKTVAGIPAVHSVLDLDVPVDLAVVAVPAASVIEVVDDCGRAGVGAVVVISAGFAESGPQGRTLEAQLLRTVRRHGMRLLGPNCLGLVNTSPDRQLHATFVPVYPSAGDVAIMSQSGTLGGAILEHAGRVGLGVSSFVSVGNKADVSGNDLLSFWADDDRTRVVLMYLESFGNPRRFAPIAREASLHKPVLAIKAGRQPNDRAESLDDATVDTLLARHGVVRVDGIGRMLDVARVLSLQGIPRGRRIAMLANSGGALRLAADAAWAAGLEVVVERDLGWDASVDEYLGHLTALIDAAAADQVLVVFAPADRRSSDSLCDGLLDVLGHRRGVPVVLSVFGPHAPLIGTAAEPRIPVFDFPDDAVIAAAHAARYGTWRQEASDPELSIDIDVRALRAGVQPFIGQGPTKPSLTDAAAVLALAGLEVVAFRSVSSPEESASAAAEIGFPVVLKAATVHGPARREAEGASLDLHDEDDVTAAFTRMREQHGWTMNGAIVQRMVDPAVDVAVGVQVDPAVGPVLSVGRSTAGRERLIERTLPPLTEREADRLLGAGFDDDDRHAARDLLARLALLTTNVPEIADVALEPVMIGSGRAAITNVSLTLAPTQPGDPPELRRL